MGGSNQLNNQDHNRAADYANPELTINVGIGEYKTARSPYILRTVLGSCVGVMIYDEVARIGGLAHVYLPYAHQFTQSPSLGRDWERLSFADVLIPRMMARLETMQGHRSRFQVNITGGGYILPATDFPRIDIGQQNLKAVREVLKKENLSPRELRIGGKHGQSVTFNLYDGGIEIKLYT